MRPTNIRAIIRPEHNYRFSLFVRFLSALFTALYIKFFYDVLFPWYAYTAKLFVKAFLIYLIYGIGCNFGLFFITTNRAKKMKIWATILYIPTFVVTPLVVGSFQPYYLGIAVVFLCSLFIYYCFNPWGNNG